MYLSFVNSPTQDHPPHNPAPAPQPPTKPDPKEPKKDC